MNNIFKVIMIGLFATACGGSSDGTYAYPQEHVSPAPTSRHRPVDPVTDDASDINAEADDQVDQPTSASPKPSDTTGAGGDSDVIEEVDGSGGAGGDDTASPPPACTVVSNKIIGDGYAPRIAASQNGYAVLWFSHSSMPTFQSFDWQGNATSKQIVLLDAYDIVAGTDDYLVEFRQDNPLGHTTWTYATYLPDGTLKQRINTSAIWGRTMPKLSFDGAHYRITNVYEGGCGSDGNGQSLFTGRISDDGEIVTDLRYCIGPSGNLAGVTGVVEQQNAAPMISFWDAGEGQAEIGAGVVVIDHSVNSYWKPLNKYGTNTSIGRGYGIQPSARGAVLSWSEQNGTNYVSMLDKAQILASYKLPQGMSATRVDNDVIVDIVRDQLTGSDVFIRASLDGTEIDHQVIASPSIKASCFRDIAGAHGTYANIGSPCLPSNDGPPQVFARIVHCK